MPPSPQGPPLSRLLLQAADAVGAVRAGRSLTDVLAACPAELRGGTQALAFHALRHLGAAEAARVALAPKPPPAAVEALLVTALALMWPSDDGRPPPYAEHTLVDQAVAAVRQRQPALAAFVNAVLRRFGREQAALVPQLRRQPVAAYNHPAWWIERVRHDWPALWQPLLAAANRHPPMGLRVNARRGTAAAYVQRLAAAGRAATACGAQAVWLAEPCPVHLLPGFADGDVSVQDISAQRAAGLLLDGDGSLPPLPAGARVLDACAAPGGKTAHLLELAELDLLALDSDGQRLQRVRQTLDRLRLPVALPPPLFDAPPPSATPGWGATLVAADARDVARWWDGRPFDAILLDAPCTASGIVRRHPDVRWLRRPDDIAALVRTQAQLLDALWPLLKPGGRLLYATCSIFRDEGQRQIDAFLQRTRAPQPRLAPASPGHLPGVPDNPTAAVPTTGAPLSPPGDGFFYALITAP